MIQTKILDLSKYKKTEQTPNVYVDSHGVVHSNPKDLGKIERGYK